MPDDVLVEGVGAHGALRCLESEARPRDKPKEGSSSRTDRAVTSKTAVNLTIHFEGDRAAVATAGEGRHGSSVLVFANYGDKTTNGYSRN